MAKNKRRLHKSLSKRFASDFINTSQGIDQNKVEAYDIFKNRQRVQSTRGSRGNTTPISDNTWMQEVPKTKHLSIRVNTGSGDVYVPTPRRLTLERKLEEKILDDGKKEYWASDRQAGFNHELHFVVERNWNMVQGELRLYFHHNIYTFVQVDSLGNRLRYSNPYKGKDLAMTKYRRGKIFWAWVKDSQG